MKCDYCGTEIPGRRRFCPFCGTRQTPMDEPAALPLTDALPAPDDADDWTPAPMLPPESGDDVVWQAEPENKPQPEAAEIPAPIPVPSPAEAPRLQLPTGRSLAKMVFLGILTLGIYPVVIWSRIVTELNLAASRADGLRTMPFFAMVWLMPFTLGIYPLVWLHRFSRRVGAELGRRGIGYRFGPRDFWLWNILGTLILVGPFVYIHKLMKSMNFINADFNARG